MLLMIGTDVGYLIFDQCSNNKNVLVTKNVMLVFSSRCIDDNFLILVVVMMIDDD